MAIQNENEFRSFLSGRIAERSISSYVSNLNAASSVLHCDISHSTLSCELHISNLCSRLADAGMPAHRIRDTRSAMKKYLEMVTYIPSEEVSQIDHRHDEPEEVVDDSRHSVNSTFREKLLEHLFIAELFKRSWRDGACDVEVAKPEVDHRGYDILVESRGILRHIQLKSTRKGGRASNQKIHLSLADKPSGCVVWTVFDEEALDIDHYLFLGGAPGEKLPPLGDRVAKHTKGNADGEKLERPMLREVPKRNFKKIETFDELYDTLFCNC